MADSKITALASIGTGTDPANDPLVIVDVSDVSPGGMSATGTTKKVTLNNLLACSPTATLASATITGDLTVDTSTLKVDSANNRVIVGHTSGSSAFQVSNAGGAGFEVQPTGVASSPALLSYNRSGAAWTQLTYLALQHVWQNSGTDAMTLNATGLGVGVSPSYNIHARGTTNGRIQVEGASGFGMVFIQASSGNAAQLQLNSSGGSGRRFNVYSDSTGLFGISDETAVATRLAIDSSGNVGIGVTPVTGGKLTVAGPIVRNKGATSCTQNVATTVATLPGEGLYIAYAYFNASNVNAFTAYAVILCDSIGSRVIASNGTQISISASAFSLQVTQAFFTIPTAIAWSFVQIG